MVRIKLHIVILLVALFALHNAVHAQDKKNGKCKITESNGNISEGKKKRGKKNGTWKTTTPSGQTVEIITFSHGVKQGYYAIYYSNGKLYQQGTYANDKREGAWTAYKKDGTLYTVATYRNDTLNGYFRRVWNTPSSESVEGTYLNGLKEGTWSTKLADEDGRDTCIFHNDRAHGEHVTWYNGVLYKKHYYVDGKLSGEEIIYHRNTTQPSSISYYRDGKLDSIQRQYSVTGIKIREAWYKNDKLIKYDSSWNDNGTILQSVRHFSAEGVLTYSESFHPFEGTVHKRYSGEDGLVDSLVVYSKNGKVSFRDHHDQLKPAEQGRDLFYHRWCYTQTGRLEKHGEFRMGYQQGMWTWVDSNNRVTKEIMYADGIPNGRYVSYYPNGKIKVKGVCVNGSLRDSIRVMSPTGAVLKKGTPQYAKIFDQHLQDEHDVLYTDPDQIIRIETIDQNPEWLGIEQAVAEDPVLAFAEIMPEFPGGSDSLQKYLYTHVRYPPMEKEQGKQGTVYIGFVVATNGTVEDVRVMRGVSGAPGLEKEALRVVKQMPPWKPGENNRRAVRVSMVLPIKFVLN